MTPAKECAEHPSISDFDKNVTPASNVLGPNAAVTKISTVHHDREIVIDKLKTTTMLSKIGLIISNIWWDILHQAWNEKVGTGCFLQHDWCGLCHWIISLPTSLSDKDVDTITDSGCTLKLQQALTETQINHWMKRIGIMRNPIKTAVPILRYLEWARNRRQVAKTPCFVFPRWTDRNTCSTCTSCHSDVFADHLTQSVPCDECLWFCCFHASNHMMCI